MGLQYRHSLICYSILAFCSSTACTKGPAIEFAPAELAVQKVLQEEPFAPESRMSGVDSENDALLPNNGLKENNEKNLEWIKRCSKDRMEEEREAAIAAAKADPLHTIPVAFAISVGSKGDTIAKYAHDRAILNEQDDGVTPVFVGPANEPGRDAYNLIDGKDDPAKWFHYKADHKKARAEYIKGEKCFFSTIKVVGEATGILLTPTGAKDHQYMNLYYGGNYATAEEMTKTPRLFEKLSQSANKDPQFVNIYVADLREFQMGLSQSLGPVILKEFSETAVRRQEYLKSLKEILDLQKIVTHRNAITRGLSKTAKVDSIEFQGIEGAPQLIDNLIHSGLAGLVMSTAYTPIVIDLGRKHIRTSSLTWGTFFNLANLRIKDTQDLKEALKLNHFTAWLGGSIEDRAQEQGEQRGFSSDMQRRADDGFLVIPDSDGVVRSGANLFGDHTKIDGKYFLNGFEALRYLAKKNCKSDSLRDTHVGPWDGDLYSSRLKIWVDSDRNGQSSPDEIQSLKQARIAAINTCNIHHEETKDRHGNQTSLRAAVLLAPEAAEWLDNEDEIFYILATGKTRGGAAQEFRVAIDIFFKTDVSFYLQNVAQENVEQGGLFSIPSSPGQSPYQDAPPVVPVRYRSLASVEP